MSPQEVTAFFSERNVHATQHSYKVGSREIHYIKAGDESKTLVLFVHGSPGSLSAFIHFLADSTLLGTTSLLASDRPGFGHSNFGHGKDHF